MTSKYDTEDYELEFMVKLKRITPLKECPMCNGRGTEIEDYYRHRFNTTCNECDGLGKVYTKIGAIQPTIPQALIDDLKAAWKKHNFPQKICPKCDGYGEWDDADFGDIQCNTYTCDKCGGVGKVDVDQKKETVCTCCKGSGYDGAYACQCCEGTGIEPKVFKCRECNGTGDYEDPNTRFETTIECPHCDGNGEIEK